MPPEISRVIRLYNPKSGQGRAGQTAKRDSLFLSPSLAVPKPIDLTTLSEEDLTALLHSSEALGTLLAVYGGDGSFFTLLSKIAKVYEQQTNSPTVIVAAMGGGGEMVAANTLGTSDTSLFNLLNALQTNPDQHTRNLTPWQVKTVDTSGTENQEYCWWVATLGNGLINSALHQMEVNRNRNYHHIVKGALAVAHAFINMSHNMAMIQALTDNNKAITTGTEIALFKPPFNKLSNRIKLPSSEPGQILTIDQHSSNVVAIALGLIGLSLFGNTFTQALRLSTIPSGSIQLEGSQSQGMLDSELLKGDTSTMMSSPLTNRLTVTVVDFSQ